VNTYPPIARPRILVVRLPKRHEARCTHCPWQYSNSGRSDVEFHARAHRFDHQSGHVTACQAEVPTDGAIAAAGSRKAGAPA
jgi:hypothetical protein